MSKLQVSVVSTQGISYQGVADTVVANGTLGELGIISGHTPLLTSLKPGPIRVLNDQDEHTYYVSGGVLEISHNQVTILADTSISAKDLLEHEIQKARENAKNLMAQKLSNEEYAKAKAELVNTAAQLATLRALRKLK
ncbi:MAG: F0F1 ATP synthase subunit epsilon [Methylacidiphilales bacterium]|nr:F0F1 ATP synthase subunit epsilon [Candidatus Methylacidiphilales bacterium]